VCVTDRVDPSQYANDADSSNTIRKTFSTNNTKKGEWVDLNSTNESTSLNESSLGNVLALEEP